jgi:uncharacterized protein YbjT (DUF2867 family)
MEILVIGGTGTVGSQVVRDLVISGHNVRVLTRAASKAQALPREVDISIGDLADPGTVSLAFDGIESLFFLVPVGPTETELGIAAVNEAVDADIRRIVYMSVALPPGSEHIPHFGSKLPIEKAVAESGLEYTILRPTNFFQNDIWLKDAITQYGVYPQPLGDLGANRVDVRDISDAAVNALTKHGYDGKTYNIFGPEDLTGEAVAQIYSKLLGRSVKYGGNDLDAWAKQASTMLPDYMVADFRIMFEYFQKHGFSVTDEPSARLTDILKHEPRKLNDFAAEITKAWLREASKV